MLNYDFDESVGYWLMTTWHLYQRAFNEEIAPHGITFRQCQVLGYLALDGTLSQCQLAERMRIEPPTLVRILDRMERDGWIERVACQQDRRRKRIRPTKAAQPVWSKMVACARRVRARATRGLSPRQQQTLQKLLRRVQKNLGAESPLPELQLVER